MLILHRIRKRKQKPKTNNNHIFLDQIIYLIAIVGPIMTIPQIVNIWIHKSSGGVSIYTFGSYLIFDFVWLYYGLVHRDKAVFFSYILWIVVNSTVVIGLLSF